MLKYNNEKPLFKHVRAYEIKSNTALLAYHFKDKKQLADLDNWLGKGYLHTDGTKVINIDGTSSSATTFTDDTYFIKELGIVHLFQGTIFRLLFERVVKED